MEAIYQLLVKTHVCIWGDGLAAISLLRTASLRLAALSRLSASIACVPLRCLHHWLACAVPVGIDKLRWCDDESNDLISIGRRCGTARVRVRQWSRTPDNYRTVPNVTCTGT